MKIFRFLKKRHTTCHYSDKSWKYYTFSAQQLLERMDWPALLVLCREMTIEFPEMADAYQWLSLAQEKVGDDHGQISSCRKAIKLDENQPLWLYLVTAQLLIKNKEWHPAYKILQDTIIRYPGSGEAYRWLGYCQENLGESSAVFESYTKAIELETQPVWVYLTIVYLHINKNEYESATLLCNQIINKNPGTTFAGDAHVHLGDILYKLGDFDEAIIKYQIAIHLSSSISVEGKLSNTLLKSYYKTLELDPERFDIICSIADHYFKINKLNTAIVFYAMMPIDHCLSSHSETMIANILRIQN